MKHQTQKCGNKYKFQSQFNKKILLNPWNET